MVVVRTVAALLLALGMAKSALGAKKKKNPTTGVVL
jgi:hypothetical protein